MNSSGIDISLLQLMKHRKEYERLHRVVNQRTIDARTQAILKDFGKFFEQVPECTRIPATGDFLTYFTQVAHRNLGESDLAVYTNILKRVEHDVPENTRDLLLHRLLEADFATKLADALMMYEQEEEIDVPQVVQHLLEGWQGQTNRVLNVPEVAADEGLFDDDVNNTGYRWRWPCLNQHMRPLRGGDFIILAGRPDKGKTTAVADNVTYMASQVDELYPDEGRNIVWLNNEGPGKRILKRCVQSALGLPTSELVKLQEQGVLWDRYSEALGMDKTRLKVLDIHGFKAWQVEELLRQLNPALIVFDMIDNVNFDGLVINGGNRQDSILEGMYQWGRELGVKHDCPVIATSQVSGDGEGLPYPTLGMLKDSKTGKQGAADVILVVGANDDAGMANTRFIGATKNKLALEGMAASPRREMQLDGACGRYIE